MSRREELIIRVALLQATRTQIAKFDANGAWKVGEEFVAAMQARPDEPVKCPCCDKMVTLCVEHYQLRQPEKPCVECAGIGPLNIGPADE
jgi:hypothetical protein